MAVGAATNVFHFDGRLVANFTDITTSALALSSGEHLGEIRAGVFMINHSAEEVTAEEFGGKRVDYVRTGDSAALTAVLREFDATSLSLIFPNVTTSSKTGRPIIKGRSFATTASTDTIKRSGSFASDKAMKLLFLPNSPDQVPAIIIYSAIPVPDAAGELALTNKAEAGFPVAFQATHDVNGHLYQIGLLADLEGATS